MRILTVPELKQLNIERIRKEMQRQGICTKAAIAKGIALSNTTCSTLINEMERAGEVLYVDQETQPIGRPINQYRYNPDFLHVGALCVCNVNGEYRIVCRTADSHGDVITRDEYVEQTLTGQRICDLANAMLAADDHVRAVCIGIPAKESNGAIDFSDIPELLGTPLSEMLREQVPVRTLVVNDADCMAFGAYCEDPGEGADLALLVYPEGTPSRVGAGYVINGKLLRGYSNMSGEMPIVYRELGISTEDADWVKDNNFAEYTTRLILSIVTTVDPPRIVLCGCPDEARNSEMIRRKCTEKLTERHMPELVFVSSPAELYVNGMVRMMLNRELFPLLEGD